MIEDVPPIVTLCFAFATGTVLGALYFGLLWLSVNQFTHGGLVWGFAVSAFARLAVIAAALVWYLAVADAGLVELGVAALGFFSARSAAIKIVKIGHFQER